MTYEPMPVLKDKSVQNSQNVQTSQNVSSSATINNSNSEMRTPSRLESIGFWVFLVTVFLAPLSFWSSTYVSLDIAKTFVIAIGTIISVILFSFVFIKEKRLILPPAKLAWASILIVISLIISSALSIHFGKSFFGQGFEIGNASFIILLFVAGLATFTIVSRQKDRALMIYTGIIAAYIVVFILHLLRLIFGPQFLSLGILNTATSSILGGWYNVGLFSMLVVVVLVMALTLLKLSTRMTIAYWILLVASALGTLVIAGVKVWEMAAALVFLGLSIFLSLEKWHVLRKSAASTVASTNSWIKSFLKSLAWLPIIAFMITAILAWQGPMFLQPAVNKLNTGYVELSLPWQMTLGVTASVIQNYPMFGVGPNHFSQAFLAYKPTDINTTDYWGAEFGNGFGLIPTFIVTQGLIGAILWILLFVFFGIISTKILKNLPQESDKRFMIISSFAVSVFLWLVAIISVPSHTILFYTFILTGLFIGVASAYGSLALKTYVPASGSKMYKILPSLISLVVIIVAIWGLVYVKKTIALAYFAGGMKELTAVGDSDSADKSFTKAISLDASDLYWQARAEVALVKAQKLAATVTSTTTASTSQAVLAQITDILGKGLSYAKSAIAFDPTNYYNYLSEARIGEAQTNVGMANAYDNTVKAYNSAIGTNPYNPSTYLSLASFEAGQKKYDDSITALGKSLQVKNNYLDAVYLLSQVYAAKGDTANAITAAKVAVELNPQNSLLLFQLGILDYNNKDYAGAVDALGKALKVQPDYANAKYFLGLSYARLNDPAKAIVQFDDLAKTNADNKDIALILSNLKAGKSIFSDTAVPTATAPVATTAKGKQSALPIKEKQ